jgi:alanyl-tRNA synthetase
MDRKQLIKAYIDFYKSKAHKEIPNASLIPVNNPTVLFTTAGMHPIITYLLGQPHPLGKRLCNVQRCIRTQDIDDVGDSYHHTFFEMLGNWSVGDYFKKEAIEFSFEFFTKILKIPLERFAVSCFAGDKTASKDEEASKVWLKLGISKDRIAFLPKEDNWWETPGPGPCGPDTEMFYWKLNNKPAPKVFDPKDKNWIEIGNDVLMQYEKTKEGNYIEAKQKNIDFGGGVERIVSTLNGLEDNYLAPHFLPIIKQIEKLSEKKYGKNEKETKSMRIIADHLKAAVFIIADGITPTNSEQGYVLRRLIRRAIRHGRNIGISHFTNDIAKSVLEIYDDYQILKNNKQKILSELEKEEIRFLETLEKGIREFEKMTNGLKLKELSGKNAFLLYQSYGFPLEIILELAKEEKIKVDEKEFNKEFEIHQNLSRTATEGKFKSGLQDHTEETTKLHTATHLLDAALRKVLGNEVQQKGSNITPERLRFDFSFNKKMTPEEIKKVEQLVNRAISEKLLITRQEMSPEQAKKSGALGFFEHKYGDIVSVYTIGEMKNPFSKEICTGPHVNNTSELGKFKITKEEASSAGVRRIKAVLE